VQAADVATVALGTTLHTRTSAGALDLHDIADLTEPDP